MQVAGLNARPKHMDPVCYLRSSHYVKASYLLCTLRRARSA
jgi:hypothetical protein